MRSKLTALVAMAIGVASLMAAPAEQTWTGAVISDSHCGAIHKSDIEHGGSITARECVIGRAGDPNLPGCVSPKYGATFVVVVGEKVYQVANQNFADLRVHAAHKVNVTGTLDKDSITVTKIVMPNP